MSSEAATGCWSNALSSQIDPILFQRRLRLVILVIGLCFAMIVSAWALSDPATTNFVGAVPSPSDSEDTHDTSALQLQQTLNPVDFNTVLWRFAPEPVVKELPPPPPLPNLELLGITSIGGQPAAMIFDPSSGHMATLKVGDLLGPTTILKIEINSVSCIAHERPFTLTLGEGLP